MKLTGVCISSVGNDSSDPATAAAVYDPNVNYTGCIVTIGFWMLKLKLPLILRGMPDAINRLSFQHDINVGDYSDYAKATAGDAEYIEGCQGYANGLPLPMRDFWDTYAINAMTIIRSWTCLRTSVLGW